MGRCPAYYLMGRIPSPNLSHFARAPCGTLAASGVNPPFGGLCRGWGQVGYALRTRAPVDARERQALRVVSPRLACVKPVASVHPEPGSNSPLYICFFLFSILNLIRQSIVSCCSPHGAEARRAGVDFLGLAPDPRLGGNRGRCIFSSCLLAFM